MVLCEGEPMRREVLCRVEPCARKKAMHESEAVSKWGGRRNRGRKRENKPHTRRSHDCISSD